jgi:hypothetical protein
VACQPRRRLRAGPTRFEEIDMLHGLQGRVTAALALAFVSVVALHARPAAAASDPLE